MSPDEKPKIYVVDTSAILNEPKCLMTLADKGSGAYGNLVVLPEVVIRELDFHSKTEGPTYEPARTAQHILDNTREEHGIMHTADLDLGERIAAFKGEGKLAWHSTPTAKAANYDFLQGNPPKNDDYILMAALELRERFPGHKVCLVTEDTNLRLKADAQKMDAQKYQKSRIEITDPTKIYEGHVGVEVDSSVFNAFYSSGPGLKKHIPAEMVPGCGKLVWNQGVTLYRGSKRIVGRYNGSNRRIESLQYALHYDDRVGLEDAISPRTIWGLRPDDDRQLLALDYLLDPNIEAVFIQGAHGTGKTRLMMTAALANVFPALGFPEAPKDKDLSRFINTKFSSGITLVRPEYTAGTFDPGALPGGLDSKTSRFFEPFFKSLEQIGKFMKWKNLLKQLKDGNPPILATKVTSYIRGLEVGDAFVCIDEFQNASRDLARLIIGRMGSGAKIAVSGDWNQIDNPYLDVRSNALSVMTVRSRSNPHQSTAAITLTKNYRKGVSKHVARLLD